MELLAPAGNWESFIAAIKNGADAVYLGGKSYSARQSAENFSNKQLLEAFDYAHLRDKKVYVAVNTLLDSKELPETLDYLYELENMGVDAVIIQDLGLLAATRKALPELRLHASTQMTVHNADGVKYLSSQGIKRIVLARELSSYDISSIRKEVQGVELEVFVHGALCYSYSGLCLFSSMVGGRSGNRGRCAQPCRMGYELHGEKKRSKLNTDEKGKYLLSPADLCLIECLPELRDAGVTSLKIEGRMKRPEYVAVVSKAYREALNRLEEEPNFRPDKNVKERLLKIFNRNFSNGYFLSCKKNFLSSKRPNNRGVFIGRVTEQKKDLSTSIKLNDCVNIGDGLVIWVSRGKAPAITVREMTVDGTKVEKAESGDIVSIRLDSRVSPGDRVFKTHDEELLNEAAQSINEEKQSRIPVDIEVRLAQGRPMKICLRDDKGNEVEVETESLAQEARKHPLDEEILRDKLERLGNTPFKLRKLKLNGEKNLMIPFSEINDSRRKASEMLLIRNRASKIKAKINCSEYTDRKKSLMEEKKVESHRASTLLTVAVSTIEAARSAAANGADRVYLGLEGLGTHKRINIKQLDELHSYCEDNKAELIPLMPRIHKAGDKFDYRQLVESGFKGLMTANLGDFSWARKKGFSIYSDYSMNVFNVYTLRFLLEQGAEGVCLSPELNLKQLQSFSDLEKAELLVHGELILMQSQFCMLHAALGNEKENCQSFCLKDSYYIKDEKGYEFPIATDADCRFYLFNSRTLCMLEDLPSILAMKPGSIRIEGRRSGAEELGKTVRIYRQALDGIKNKENIDLHKYRQNLENVSRSAFTKCHYYRGVL